MAGTPGTEKRLTQAEALRTAEQKHRMLANALRRRGIVLPSLGVDAAAYASESRDILLDLGRCNLETADKLIEALAEGNSSGLSRSDRRADEADEADRADHVDQRTAAAAGLAAAVP